MNGLARSGRLGVGSVAPQLGAAVCVAALCGMIEFLGRVLFSHSIGLTYSGLIRTLALVAVVYAATAGLAGAAIAAFSGRLELRGGPTALSIVVFLWAAVVWHLGFEPGVAMTTIRGIAATVGILLACGFLAFALRRANPVLVITALSAFFLLELGAAITRSTPFPVDRAQPIDPVPGWYVLIVSDTLAASHSSLYGSLRPTTPNLEAIGREAVVFDRAIAPSSWTRPSVTSLFTSLYPHSHQRVGRDGSHLESQVTTLAELFQNAGYATAAFVSNLTIRGQYGYDQGFAVFDDYQALEKSPCLLGDVSLFNMGPFRALESEMCRKSHAEQWRGERINERFFEWFDSHDFRGGFVYLHYMDAHDPYEPPDEFAIFGDTPRDGYDGDVLYWDSVLGDVVAFLKARGVWNSATIVVTADHGEEFGEHGQRGHAHTLYQELIHVPLVIKAPGFQPHRADNVVSLLDIGPTLTELAGVPGFPVSEGTSLLPALRDHEIPQRTVLSELLLRPGLTQVGVVRYPSKLIYRPRTGEAEAFDLESDPGEQSNVVSENPSWVLELLGHFDGLAVRGGALRPPLGVPTHNAVTIEGAEALRALGYLD